MKRCVIFNPVAARGRAAPRLKSLKDMLGSEAEFWATSGPGNGEELAFKAASDGFSLVAAAGGDGTVHEVANGLLRACRPDAIFEVLPLGSANDYAHALGITLDSWARPQTARSVQPFDVGRVSTTTGKTAFFINTLGLGFSGSVALESRAIRHLQGLALYGLAFLRALCFRFDRPSMVVRLDANERVTRTLSLTVAIGQREGSFVVAPEALPNDGLFDYLHVGPISRWQVLRFMPTLASGGQLPHDHPAIWRGHCRKVKVKAESPLTVHIDGEFFSKPEDGVRDLEIEMLPNALRVHI